LPFLDSTFDASSSPCDLYSDRFGRISINLDYAIVVDDASPLTDVCDIEARRTRIWSEHIGACETASQVAGIDTSTGGSAKESATIEVLMAGGKPDSILVTKVTPGGAYDKHFGLKENDTILQIGPLPIKELIKSDDDAEAFLLDAFQRQQALLVVRDGNQLTLPQAPPPGKPASTDGKGSTDPLQQQLDGIGARRGL
jgi:hypothetical protein